MRGIWQRVSQFVREEDGTETVEWGVMAGLMVAGLVGIVAAIGTWIHTRMTNLQTNLGTP